ncbi:ParB N-terminal domain-containing protein [Howardella ureilytica]
MKKQEKLYSFPQQNDCAVVETDIRMIPLSELHDFNGHPFKVENDMVLSELMQSIEKEGVIVSALSGPREDGGYELIAGRRRKAAC